MKVYPVKDPFDAVVRKKYGDGTLVPLSDFPSLKRIPTGIFALDVGLGGGIPLGRTTLIWGNRSAGKSTLSGHVIKQAQCLCRYDGLPIGNPAVEGFSNLPIKPSWTDPKGNVISTGELYTTQVPVDPDKPRGKKENQDIPVEQAAYNVVTDEDGNEQWTLEKGWKENPYQEPMRVLIANVEGVIDKEWVTQLGCDPSGIYVLTIETAEQTIDVVDSALREGFADLVIVDSLAQMTPSFEVENSAENKSIGKLAMLVNQALRKWVSAIVSRRDTVHPTLLLINQVRQKVGVMYGSPDIKPAGVGQDFAPSCEIRLRSGKREKEDFAPDNVGAYLKYSRTNFKIEKNKTYPPLTAGQYITALAPVDGWVPGEIVQIRQILETAKKFKVLYKDKSKWILGERSFKTLNEIVAWAKAEPIEFEFFQRALTELVCSMQAGWISKGVMKAGGTL